MSLKIPYLTLNLFKFIDRITHSEELPRWFHETVELNSTDDDDI